MKIKLFENFKSKEEIISEIEKLFYIFTDEGFYINVHPSNTPNGYSLRSNNSELPPEFFIISASRQYDTRNYMKDDLKYSLNLEIHGKCWSKESEFKYDFYKRVGDDKSIPFKEGDPKEIKNVDIVDMLSELCERISDELKIPFNFSLISIYGYTNIFIYNMDRYIKYK